MRLPNNQLKPYINGSFVDAVGDEKLDVENPATGEVIAEVQAASSEDVDDAIDAARRSFATEWRETRPNERAEYLYEIADRISAHHDELAELETLENGKPLSQAGNDVSNTANAFQFYAGATDKYFGDTIRDNREEVIKSVHEPYGVVGIILPYNWPPIHVADFAAPALAAGNTVVLKTAPQTPLSALQIAEIVGDVLPDGVLNIIPGGGEPAAALTSNDDVDMVTFTGSDETGEKVLHSTAETITPTMLELGGKNPALVFPEADIEKTASGLIYNTFYNSGQACTNPERWLIHEDVVGDIIDRVVPEVEDLTVGDGMAEDTEVGPQINAMQLQKFETALEKALDDGAEILAQADTPSDPGLKDGYWAPPTLLGNVSQTMDVAHEEVFGPIATILTFESEEEAIEIANNVEYGLAAAIWSQNVNRAHRVAREIDAGIITINHPTRGKIGVPFGGFKRSGMGKKRGFIDTLQEYSRTKSVQMDLTDQLFPLNYGNQ